MPTAQSAAAPIFVLCCSRSGSTLLRYVLDAHAEIACPPELHLGELCATLRWSYALTQGHDVFSRQEPGSLETRMPDAVRDKCRSVVDAMMSEYLQRQDKPRWCDKSVTTVDQLALIQEIFPDAKFICLYRNAMDMVHSGLEVSRFGFSGYGFAPFIARRLDNTVAGLIDYWCDKVQKMLDFEERQAQSCLRLRYEDLVYEAPRVVPELLEFLDCTADPGLIERIFAVPHQDGPGDANIAYTRKIEAGSVGKGSTLSSRLVSKTQAERMNALLARLEYPQFGADWDRQPSPYARTPAALPKSTTAMPTPAEALQMLTARLGAAAGQGRIQFVFDEPAGEAWVLELGEGGAKIFPATGEAADCEVRLALAHVVAVARGEINPMSLLRAGEMRVAGNIDLVRTAFLN